ncbi:MAG: DUF2304 domain-containing protein [Kiritimatiellia bacterium]
MRIVYTGRFIEDYPRQYVASIIMSMLLLVLIVRLVQKGRLDIHYCWIWLAIGIGAILCVVRYDWLTRVSRLIGAVANTTTLFLMAFFVVLLMCLQFSLVVSKQRRQIKKLTQALAILSAREHARESTGTAARLSENRDLRQSVPEAR